MILSINTGRHNIIPPPSLTVLAELIYVEVVIVCVLVLIPIQMLIVLIAL